MPAGNPPSPVRGAGAWRSYSLGLLALLWVGCAAHAPVALSLPAVSVAMTQVASGWGESTEPGSGGALGEERALAEAMPDGAAGREEASGRARRVEEERVGEWVHAARREGRGPDAEETARKAEAARVLAQVVERAREVDEVGATLAFTFWREEGALTPLGHSLERGGERAGRSAEVEGLERMLYPVFSEYVGRHTGEVVLTLRREEARWRVGYDATRQGARPPEAKTLPLRTRGTTADSLRALHEAARKGLSAVQVPSRGAARVELAVRLEDGRPTGWELLEARHTHDGAGGAPRPLSPGVVGHTVQVLLPFTEGIGPRSVHLVLRAEHRSGVAEVLRKRASALPIHHRRQLEHAHLFPDENINAGENLVMVQRYVHDKISSLWGRFRKARPNPTADEVRRAAEIIDGHFEPWYHRVGDPPGLSKTAEEAKEAALRELRGRFPGLD